ncbi:hypothetical protein MM326_15115 [Alkalihalobacillus sp. LMS6]|uniref:hypothetical protein n=1 Tax=Alkalihalobacillus sp. LMS6 TaxID=2924034 RepID=UPI0020D08880|nr:hypothetical protein [Alkalihalobacillus sp. LMS6]UTR05426.1 hypothetical protein MM326_15115 [Alkalihalobacillus sp. LMS6]
MKLPEFLNKDQKEIIQHAIDTNTPIIISGKQGPTGKTTLKELLVANGVKAFEEWECTKIELSINLSIDK